MKAPQVHSPRYAFRVLGEELFRGGVGRFWRALRRGEWPPLPLCVISRSRRPCPNGVAAWALGLSGRGIVAGALNIPGPAKAVTLGAWAHDPGADPRPLVLLVPDADTARRVREVPAACGCRRGVRLHHHPGGAAPVRRGRVQKKRTRSSYSFCCSPGRRTRTVRRRWFFLDGCAADLSGSRNGPA